MIPTLLPILAKGKAFFAFLSNPKLIVPILILALMFVSYQYGRSQERTRAQLAASEEVANALEKSRAATERAVALEREAFALRELLENRDDQESIDWAAEPTPAGSRKRVQQALDQISARPSSASD